MLRTILHQNLIDRCQVNKIRRTAKTSWSSEQMEAALNAIRNGRSTWEVAKLFGIARSTLQDRLKSGNASGPSMVVFTKEDEGSLVDPIIKLS